MKKSNRLILVTIGAVVLLIILTNLLLYDQLRKGHITSLQDVQAAQRTHYDVKPVHHLQLTGTIWVNIVPSDRDRIEIPEEERILKADEVGMLGKSQTKMGWKTPFFRQSSDTLYIVGSNEVPLHRPYADWFYRQGLGQIYIYASEIKSIRLKNGQILIRGAEQSGIAKNVRLEAINSTVWVAEPEGKQPPPEYFDSVSLHLVNSVLLLNKPATIAALNARLDSASELTDRQAILNHPQISTSMDSRVSFTGENLKTTSIVIHQ